MQLAQFLFERLRNHGVDCTFGIPGDFALPLYAAQAEAGMRTVVCTHEPGAAFAADAYARLKGLGVAVATYGAGALNMVNAVAMSYAERTPVLIVSGAPDTVRRGPDVYIHHMVKRFESQWRIFKEITIDSAVLDDPETAAARIDRVLASMLREKRPGYLEIPRDLTNQEIRLSSRQNEISGPDVAVDRQALDEATAEIQAMLLAARAPALYVGVGARRHGITGEIVEWAERWGLPVATSVMGKASFPESHPLFVGVYMGALGDQEARRVLEESDCLISLGVIESDVNTGFWTHQTTPQTRIRIDHQTTRVRYHQYSDLPARVVLSELLKKPAQRKNRPPAAAAEVSAESDNDGGPLSAAQIIRFLRGLDQSRHVFVADVGDAWFMGLELRADLFLAPGYYATMGFAVPGALGAGIADRTRRPFVLVGDGAFQMTGTELGTMKEEGLNPIVLLINNSCYTMLEALDSHRTYYDRPPWDYVAFAKSMGCAGERVKSLSGLWLAYRHAQTEQVPFLIEALIDKHDLSPVMRRIQRHFSEKRKG